MKLGISHMAWREHPDLRCVGVDFHEMLPDSILIQVFDNCFEVPPWETMQGILHNTKYQLGVEDYQLQSHMDRIAQMAVIYGAKLCVIGGATNRKRGDEMSMMANLAEIAKTGEIHNIIFALEPLHESYGGCYLNSAKEVAEVVRVIDSPNLRMVWDTASATLAGEPPSAVADYSDVLAHFHVSAPNLVQPGPLDGVDHEGFAKAFATFPDIRVCLEARDLPSLTAVRHMVDWGRKVYGGY